MKQQKRFARGLKKKNFVRCLVVYGGIFCARMCARAHACIRIRRNLKLKLCLSHKNGESFSKLFTFRILCCIVLSIFVVAARIRLKCCFCRRFCVCVIVVVFCTHLCAINNKSIETAVNVLKAAISIPITDPLNNILLLLHTVEIRRDFVRWGQLESGINEEWKKYGEMRTAFLWKEQKLVERERYEEGRDWKKLFSSFVTWFDACHKQMHSRKGKKMLEPTFQNIRFLCVCCKYPVTRIYTRTVNKVLLEFIETFFSLAIAAVLAPSEFSELCHIVGCYMQTLEETSMKTEKCLE